MRTKNLAIALSATLVVGPLATASFSKAFANQREREEHIVTKYYKEHPRAPRVPECDPGVATSSLAMLGGGLLLISDRLRRRKKAKGESHT